MYARKRSNPISRDSQLRRGLRTCSPTLQRQHTHDHLQTIRKPMLELLGQRVVTLQEVGLLTKPYLFPGASRLQFVDQRVILRLPTCIALDRTLRKLNYVFLGVYGVADRSPSMCS